ncbi:hypothetical protein J6590_007289 [Homalodisca vitripennis]|nr:hypothetical protein J6590_007289 [Homalodisca vitripennis]
MKQANSPLSDNTISRVINEEENFSSDESFLNNFGSEVDSSFSEVDDTDNDPTYDPDQPGPSSNILPINRDTRFQTPMSVMMKIKVEAMLEYYPVFLKNFLIKRKEIAVFAVQPAPDWVARGRNRATFVKNVKKDYTQSVFHCTSITECLKRAGTEKSPCTKKDDNNTMAMSS